VSTTARSCSEDIIRSSINAIGPSSSKEANLPIRKPDGSHHIINLGWHTSRRTDTPNRGLIEPT
jgi:hypothetical protein